MSALRDWQGIAAQARGTGEAREFSLIQTVTAALGANPSLQVQRLSLEQARTTVATARAVFDPTLSAELARTFGRDDVDYNSAADSHSDSQKTAGSLTLQEFLPTGTTVQAGADLSWYDQHGGGQTATRNLGYDVSVTQALLRGRGLGVNLVSLRQARLDVRLSEYELRGAAEELVANTEAAYWEHVLSEQAIEIYQASLDVAERQVGEARERIRVGKLAATEQVAAEAEAASRREDLINAVSRLAKARLNLNRLLAVPDGDWSRPFRLLDKAELPAQPLDSVEAHVELARRCRPDLNQARLQLERGELTVVQTRNGLLPRLDLFIQLGRNNYASAFSSSADSRERQDQAEAGLRLSQALGRRAEEAAHQRAQLSVESAREALRNLELLAQVDVRGAYVEILRAAAQIEASRATVKLRTDSLRIEQEKFRLGRSTSLLVAQASRDLVSSRIAEIQAVVAYRLALLELYRLEGSLLERRGVGVQG